MHGQKNDMETLKIGNLLIQLNKRTGAVKVDTNGAPWSGRIDDLAAEIAMLLQSMRAAKNDAA